MSDEYDWTQDHDWVGAVDEEALADMRLRDATERESGRVRQTAAVFHSPVVTTWKCRHPRCDRRVPVTADAIDTLEIFNRELERRGEMRIAEDGIVVCAEHLGDAKAHRSDKLREKADRIRQNIRQLKDANDPLLLPDVVADLRRDHHPDVDGLLAAIAARKPSKRRSRL